MTGCESERQISLCRKFLFPFAALGVFLFSIYANSFDCSWHLDDFHSITDNPRIQMKDLSWKGISSSLHSDLNHPETLYRPVAGLTFALNHWATGKDPFSYHAVNVLIHWLSSFFLFLFLYQTLNLPSFRQKYAESAYSIALLSAALWTINPIQTQSVTYIVQRMTSLAGMFYILSMFFYVMGRIALDRAKVFYWVLSLAAFILALGSKENAVLLPLSIILYEWILGRTEMGSWMKKNKARVLVALAFILTAGMMYLYYRKGGLLSFLSDYEERPFTLIQRLLTEPRVILFYITLIFYPLPSRLNIAHSFEISTSLFNPASTLFAVLVLSGGVALACIVRRKYPILSFSFLFFFVNHALESSVLPLELVFEHRNYVPSMMVFFPVAIGICLLFKRYASAPWMKILLVVFVILLLAGFGHATYLRNFAWKTEETLWADATMKAPDQFRAHHNLAVAYEKQGKIQAAISQFEKAMQSKGINRKREMVVTYFHLGRAYHQLGDFQKAEGLYEKALGMDANLVPALSGLALLYDAKGDTGRTLSYLERALRADSENPHVNFNLGLYYMKQEDMDRAEPHFKKAVLGEAAKGSAELYLGMIFKHRGQLGRAAISLKASAASHPKDITPHLHLLEVYHLAGLQPLSFREAEIVCHRIGLDEALFRQTVDLIMVKGTAPDVLLSGDTIIPALYQAMSRKAEAFESQRTYLKKLLDKDSKIE